MSSGARAREKQGVFFYRYNYRRITRVLFVVFVFMLIQTIIIGYQLVTRARPQYFATTTSGKVIVLSPLSRAQAQGVSQQQQTKGTS